MRSADAKSAPILLVELRNQPGFPCQVLSHRFAIAGVPVVNEKKIIDAFPIDWHLIRRCSRIACFGPRVESAFE